MDRPLPSSGQRCGRQATPPGLAPGPDFAPGRRLAPQAARPTGRLAAVVRRALAATAMTAMLATLSAADVYVSPQGDDAADGLTPATARRTLALALRQAREMRRLATAEAGPTAGQPDVDITIHVAAGTYTLYEPLRLRPEDSGTPAAPLRIVGEPGATLSGGMALSGWQRRGGMVVVDVPDHNGRPIDFRQLYVNGRKAVWARDVADFDQMARIRRVDKGRRALVVDATPALRRIAASGPGHAEMVLHEMWCTSNLRLRSVTLSGDSAFVTFHDPEAAIQFDHPWPSPMVTPDGTHNSPYYLQGHRALLDEPGEWWHDLRAGRLYYRPLPGETVTSMTVPALETLIEAEGTADRPVHDIAVEGLTLCHTTWMRPSTHGHVPLQGGQYLTEAYRLSPKMVRPDRNHKLDNQGWLGRPAAAVRIAGAARISFSHCTFTHLGASGIDYEGCTQGGAVTGCTLTDIAGSAIVAGTFAPAGWETHLPVRLSDLRGRCDGLAISDNLIDHVGTEDWGCVGILAGLVSHCHIEHNEVRYVPYTGISLGWSWTSTPAIMEGNEVTANLVHHYAAHMYDVAGIYTLGAQPATYVTANVVRDICTPAYVHDPNHWFYLYTDEGSSYITLRDNWTPTEKYLKNANGPGNTWENNGPAVADSIAQRAGRLPH